MSRRSVAKARVILRSPPPNVHGRTYQRWARMCGQKILFTDSQEAAKRAVELGLHIYRCGYGPHWHMTGQAGPWRETDGVA